LTSRETPVKFEANRLKEIKSTRTSGVALRLVSNGRIGFASSTKPDDAAGVVEAALETAPFGPEARFEFPKQAEGAVVEVYDAATESLPVDEMIEMGQSVVDGLRRAESELLCDAGVSRSVQTVRCVNSNGGGFSYRHSQLSAGVYGTLIRGTDMLFVGDGDASCRADVDLKSIEANALRQLEWARETARVKTGEMPVIFTPVGVAGALMMPLLMAFSGRMVHQGQSPLADCLGDEMYDPRLSVWDDGTLDYRLGARPFDDEGVASRRVPLIEDGAVANFLYDLQTAGLAGAKSTASASRSLTSQPSISSSCVVVKDGDATFQEMIAGVKEGLVVEELMGARQGNVMGGDFSGNVLLGYKIEGGEIVGRVKDTIVAGNVHKALRRVAAIGSEGRWVGGSLYTPAMWIEGLSVSAKGGE
jgi:PmbA protein